MIGGGGGAAAAAAAAGGGGAGLGIDLRRPVARDRFASIISPLKTTTYQDPAIRVLGSHSIRTIAWSPTGRYIATGAGDQTLRVWNPERPALKNSTEFRGHVGAIERVAWNPVKEAELASCGADGTVRFWDVRQKTCRAEVKLNGEGLTLAWSPDGKTLIAGRKDDALIPISLADGTNNAKTTALWPQGVQTNQIIFSHSGEQLLMTTGAGTIKLLSYPDLDLDQTLHAHTSACLSLEIDPRGKYLGIAGSDSLLTLWDTTDWISRHTLSEYLGPVRSISFTFDGSYVCGGCDEGETIDIAHVETGEFVYQVPIAHPAPYVAWHPHRYWLAYSGDPMGLNIIGPIINHP